MKGYKEDKWVYIVFVLVGACLALGGYAIALISEPMRFNLSFIVLLSVAALTLWGGITILIITIIELIIKPWEK